MDRSDVSGMNCFGACDRDTGQSLPPTPPHKITGVKHTASVALVISPSALPCTILQRCSALSEFFHRMDCTIWRSASALTTSEITCILLPSHSEAQVTGGGGDLELGLCYQSGSFPIISGSILMSGECNVLVTGGAGFIGSHAVLALQDAGYCVTVLDDLSTGLRRAVPEDVFFFQGNVGDRSLVDRIIEDRRIGAIMHFAGSVIVPESVANPLKYYRNNAINTEILIKSAVSNGVRHFVFSSSAAVYGVPDRIPVDEDVVARPLNPYGASKLISEMMLGDVAAAHPFNFCALRYFNVAGADPNGRAGQSTPNATHLIKVALEAALGKRPEVAIFGDDYETVDGTGVRDYIHVADLAEAHVSALNKLRDQPTASWILNCGYGAGHSVIEVLDAVERVSGKRIRRRVCPRRPGDPPALVADNRKLLSMLNWKPRYADLDTIVSHALAWELSLARTT